MVRAFDAATALADGVNSTADAWRFITTFARQWTTAFTADDGFSGAEIIEAEARLGTCLPKVLCEALMLFGRRGASSWQDPITSPRHLYFERHGAERLLVFRQENQGGWAWGIAEQDLDHDDPPVLLCSDVSPGPRPHFLRTSVALIQATLSEQAFLQQYDGGGLARIRSFSPGFLGDIEAACPSIALLASALSHDPDQFRIRWHAAPGCLIEITQGPIGGEAVLIARTADDLRRALAKLPGPWSPPSDPQHPQPARLPVGIDDPWAVPGGHFAT